MEAWWAGLGFLNKGFLLASIFFSALFLWQILGALAGADAHDASGHDGPDTGVGHDHGHGHEDQGNDHTGFSLVSVRSVVAFFTLFSWAATLYLMTGTSVWATLLFSAGWGFAAMFGISYVLYKLMQLQEMGNVSLWSAVGELGSVYIDVPEGGVGKIRVRVGGVVSYVNARSKGGWHLSAGTAVKVVGLSDRNILEVEPTEDQKEV